MSSITLPPASPPTDDSPTFQAAAMIPLDQAWAAVDALHAAARGYEAMARAYRRDPGRAPDADDIMGIARRLTAQADALRSHLPAERAGQ